MSRWKKIRKILLKVLTALFSVALMAAVCFLLILAQPKREDTEKPEPQPLLTASPAVNISAETEIRTLVKDFPAPVLSFMSGSGMLFVSGTSSDVGLSGGFGRMASLYWQTPEGEPLILQSIYPASAISLLDNGYHFSAVAGIVFGGVLDLLDCAGAFLQVCLVFNRDPVRQFGQRGRFFRKGDRGAAKQAGQD